MHVISLITNKKQFSIKTFSKLNVHSCCFYFNSRNVCDNVYLNIWGSCALFVGQNIKKVKQFIFS